MTVAVKEDQNRMIQNATVQQKQPALEVNHATVFNPFDAKIKLRPLPQTSWIGPPKRLS